MNQQRYSQKDAGGDNHWEHRNPAGKCENEMHCRECGRRKQQHPPVSQRIPWFLCSCAFSIHHCSQIRIKQLCYQVEGFNIRRRNSTLPIGNSLTGNADFSANCSCDSPCFYAGQRYYQQGFCSRKTPPSFRNSIILDSGFAFYHSDLSKPQFIFALSLRYAITVWFRVFG